MLEDKLLAFEKLAILSKVLIAASIQMH